MAGNGSALATVDAVTDPRELALLKAVGFDRLQPEQRELALSISKRYELDPLLKHLVMIEGRAYITRDGLLHIAHRSGQLDGIETTEPAIIDGFWRASCSVYRKDMSRPFTYTGRYPTSGGNQKFAPEMAVKVAEVMALRRAFDVAAPTAEERWDVPAVADVVESKSAGALSLAERAAAKAAEIANEPAPQEAATEPPVEAEEANGASMSDAATAPAGSAESRSVDPAKDTWDGKPLGRLLFMDQLSSRGIPLGDASAKSDELFPGIEPKSLTDAQRGALLQALTA